jgi:hypothetical protein
MSHKKIKGLQYIHENYDTDYVFISGADLFVNIDVLFSEVSLYNPENAFYMGSGYDENLYRRFGQTHYQYHNGGTGVVISNRVLQTIQPYLDDMYSIWKSINKKYKQSLHNARDIMIGYFISKYIPSASYITNSLFTQKEYGANNNTIPDRFVSYYPMIIGEYIPYYERIKSNDYFLEVDGNYDSDTDETEELVFMKSNPPKIYFGTRKVKKEITAIVLEKCISTEDGKIHILKTDKERDAIFGDPIRGEHKSIFIHNKIHGTTYRKCIDENIEIVMRII